MTAVPVTPPGAEQALRPFLLLAIIAFVVGFAGYVALVRPVFATPDAGPSAAITEPAAAASPASDDWNLPKHI